MQLKANLNTRCQQGQDQLVWKTRLILPKGALALGRETPSRYILWYLNFWKIIQTTKCVRETFLCSKVTRPSDWGTWCILEQGEVHVLGLRRHAIGRGKQVPHAVPASQEQNSFGQSSIPNRNLMVTSGIAPSTILLSDYEQL